MPISFITEECDAIHTVVHILSSCTEMGGWAWRSCTGTIRRTVTTRTLVVWGASSRSNSKSWSPTLRNISCRMARCHVPVVMMVSLKQNAPTNTWRSAPTSSNWAQLLSSPRWRNNSTTEYTWLLAFAWPLSQVCSPPRAAYSCNKRWWNWKRNHAPVTMNPPIAPIWVKLIYKTTVWCHAHVWTSD